MGHTPASEPTADGTLDDLLALERRVWQAMLDGAVEADLELLSSDFLGVYPTGFAGRDDHAGQLDHGPSVVAYSIDEARSMRLADGCHVVAYRARYQRAVALGEPPADEESMYVSSVWCRRDERWVNVFSQDTPPGAAVV